eukprot:PhF_6_TR33887/c0_g1_i1/m.49728
MSVSDSIISPTGRRRSTRTTVLTNPTTTNQHQDQEPVLDPFSNDAFRNYLFRSVIETVEKIQSTGSAVSPLLPSKPDDTPLTGDVVQGIWGTIFNVQDTSLGDINARFSKMLLKRVQIDAIPSKELTFVYIVLLRKESKGVLFGGVRKRDYMLLELRCRYDELLQKIPEPNAAAPSTSIPASPVRVTGSPSHTPLRKSMGKRLRSESQVRQPSLPASIVSIPDCTTNMVAPKYMIPSGVLELPQRTFTELTLEAFELTKRAIK